MSKNTSSSSPKEQDTQIYTENALTRFETLVLELNRAVFQFGLFLPPIEMWEHSFYMLDKKDMIYGTNLLRTIYTHVHNPSSVISMYGISDEQQEAAVTSDKMFDDFMKSNHTMGDLPTYAQSLSYITQSHNLPAITRLYKDYLIKLQERLCVVSLEKYNISIGEGFNMTQKLTVETSSAALEKVAEFLVDEGCIDQDAIPHFLAIFNNIPLNDGHRIVWRMKTLSKKTNIAFLKELFVALGVDMENIENRKIVAEKFCDKDGKSFDIRTKGARPKISEAQKNFHNRIKDIINGK